jgi:hypothetical protein
MVKPTPSQLRACARWNWEKAQLAKGQNRQADHDRLLKQAISLGQQARDIEMAFILAGEGAQ